ncbi:MAG: Ig-like domain-containing protein, partial [Gemmatimonadota bacterium]
EARALVDGDNLILVFEDEGRVIFENLVELAQLRNGPGLQFGGEDLIGLLIGQGVIPAVLDGMELTEPGRGQITEINADLGQRYIVNFDPSLAQVTVNEGNMVLAFANGGQIIIHGLGELADQPDAPSFVIVGTEVKSATFFGPTDPLSGEARPNATPTLETAVGGVEPAGTGATNVSEDLGSTIDLLEPQDVILPVEEEFGAIDLEPEELTAEQQETEPAAPLAHDDTDKVLEGAGDGQDALGSTSGNVLSGVDPDSDPLPRGNQVADLPGDSGPITVISFDHDGVNFDPATPADGANVLFNDGTVIEIRTALEGTLTFNFATGAYTYLSPVKVSHAGSSDPVEVFSYTIENGDGLIDSANLSITVKDSGPTANDDSNGANNLVGGNVLTNDDQGLDAPSTVTAIEGGIVGVAFDTPVGGKLIVNSDGDYTSTAPASAGEAEGPFSESFNYTITDSDGSTSTAVLTITVTDTGPDARDDALSVDEGATLHGNVLSDNGFGADGFGPDGAGTVAQTVTGSLGTVLTIAADGSFSYTAPVRDHADAVADEETFTYTITDSDGTPGAAVLTITINDTAPDAREDALSVAEGATLRGNVLSD